MDVQNRPQDDRLAVLERLAVAIAVADVPRILAEFWHSDQVVMVGSELGEEAEGTAQLRELWTRVVSRGQVYRWSWKRPRAVMCDGVAWIATDAVVQITEGTSQREVQYRATLVLVRDSKKWVIAQYHGSEPAAAW